MAKINLKRGLTDVVLYLIKGMLLLETGTWRISPFFFCS